MLVFSDVCDTLVDINSTNSYIKFLYNHKYWNKVLWYLLNNRLFSLFSVAILRFFGYDLQRKLTPLFFKRINKSDLCDINKIFRNFYIWRKTKVLDMIMCHKKKWDKVVLISASINPPIDMIGNYLWVDYFSTVLEEDKKWMYTWKFVEDLLWNKESLLENNMLNIKRFDDVAFYTDNLSDINFIKKIQTLSKNAKFYLIVKSDKIKNKRLNLLHSNNIVNYEFIS